MKIDPIPSICFTALTLMTGAVVNHWLGVDERIDLALLRAGQPPTPQVESPFASPPAATPATILVADQSRTPSDPAAADPAISPDLGQRFVRALESFEQLQRENRNLRDQVAETNRDLMELQFRVDTHSESFRPLRAAQEPQRPANPGVLPPLEIP